MQVSKARLKGVKLIFLDVFEDHRGRYLELFNERWFIENVADISFVQDDGSISRKNVLRGIHGDNETYKLISCLYGAIYLVIVDVQEQLWQSFTLNGDGGQQVLVPPGDGVAHLVLSDWAVFHYKQSTYYHPEKQFTYRYDDSRFGIWWPTDNPILSERDKGGKNVS